MIGPATTLQLDGGKTANLYLIRFGKDGRLESTKTAQLALEEAHTATDVYVFSHGWNTVYGDALEDYEAFARGFIEQRQKHQLPVPEGYKPVLIGIIWPSTWFVSASERGPRIAGGPSEVIDEQLLSEITEDMPEEPRSELLEILDGAASLTQAEAERVAELILPLWLWQGVDGSAMGTPNVKELLATWATLGHEDVPFNPDDGPVGTLGGTANATDTGEKPDIEAAGGNRWNPKDALRLLSVWAIKARAGDVGKFGLAPLLDLLLNRSAARVHLIGHSFGARLVLSAIAHSLPSRRVHSMLLLQGAVNRWCFAQQVVGTDRAGGYAQVPGRVERPIMTTYSKHDVPLHEFFHLAVRGGSLGEFNAAAVGDTERYGALGGYGPSGVEFNRQDALGPAQRYALDVPRGTIIAVDCSGTIDGAVAIPSHGEVNNPVTWWMLHNLIES